MLPRPFETPVTRSWTKFPSVYVSPLASYWHPSTYDTYRYPTSVAPCHGPYVVVARIKHGPDTKKKNDARDGILSLTHTFIVHSSSSILVLVLSLLFLESPSRIKARPHPTLSHIHPHPHSPPSPSPSHPPCRPHSPPPLEARTRLPHPSGQPPRHARTAKTAARGSTRTRGYQARSTRGVLRGRKRRGR